jgi:phosphoglycerate dehydrogenase-like enzyme
MRVTGASRSPARFAGAQHDYDAVVSLSDALLTTVRDADAVVLCLPQTAETVGLVGREVLGRMQPCAMLINLARPLLVDEHALLRCLRERRIAAAWVSRTEALSLRQRLVADRLPNFFLTHYVEARVPVRRRRSFELFVDLADRQREGEVGNRVI